MATEITQTTAEATAPAQTTTQVAQPPVLVSAPATGVLAEVEAEERRWTLLQRKLKPYVNSSLLPPTFRGSFENCLIAHNMAQRMGADLMAVTQNLYVVHGNPGWSAKFAISAFNTCGKFTSIKYRFDGDGEDYGCTAYATERATGEVVEGPKVTWRMVKAEGWYGKNGSKWKTIPELMFRYRAAAYLISTTAPELLNGLRTDEENQDMVGSQPIEAETVVEAPTAQPVRPTDRLSALVSQAEAEEESQDAPGAQTDGDDSEAVDAQAEIAQERELAKAKARARRKTPVAETNSQDSGEIQLEGGAL